MPRIWYEGGSDFSRRPRAVYFVGGREVEDKEREGELFRDVPRKSLEDVVREVLG